MFHYGDGELSCWQYDNMEGSCRDYPLRDGIMVRQYDVGVAPNRYVHSYTLFRYLPDGAEEKKASLALVEEYQGETMETMRYRYDLNGNEVAQDDFESAFAELVDSKLLDRSDWTPAAQWDGTG